MHAQKVNKWEKTTLLPAEYWKNSQIQICRLGKIILPTSFSDSMKGLQMKLPKKVLLEEWNDFTAKPDISVVKISGTQLSYLVTTFQFNGWSLAVFLRSIFQLKVKIFGIMATASIWRIYHTDTPSFCILLITKNIYI